MISPESFGVTGLGLVGEHCQPLFLVHPKSVNFIRVYIPNLAALPSAILPVFPFSDQVSWRLRCPSISAARTAGGLSRGANMDGVDFGRAGLFHFHLQAHLRLNQLNFLDQEVPCVYLHW